MYVKNKKKQLYYCTQKWLVWSKYDFRANVDRTRNRLSQSLALIIILLWTKNRGRGQKASPGAMRIPRAIGSVSNRRQSRKNGTSVIPRVFLEPCLPPCLTVALDLALDLPLGPGLPAAVLSCVNAYVRKGIYGNLECFVNKVLLIITQTQYFCYS